MFKFFSFINNGEDYLYFNWEERNRLLKDNPKNYNPDSHSSIVDYFSANEDLCGKYKYNPLTKVFVVDSVSRSTSKQDKQAEEWVRKLDFSQVVKPLVIKDIVHPFSKFPYPKVTKNDIALLGEWASIKDSVWDSVMASVWASIGDSVWASIRDSIRDSVWDSVWASVVDSVRDSVRDSVVDSIWDSVWAYTGSFLLLPRKSWKYTEKIKTEVYPLQPAVDLWEKGIVPSFDGTTWRIHGGEKAKVLYEMKK